MVMENRAEPDTTSARPLIALTPELAQRLRDPRNAVGIALVVAGAVALFVGYWGVSGTLDPGKQLPYIISGGIGGIFLLGAGVACFFSSELAELRRQQTEVLSTVQELRDALDRSTQQAQQAQQAQANGQGRARRPARATP
jgi:hypothetical protein